MANTNAKRDGNREAVGLVYDDTDTKPLKVDPSNQRLIIEIAVVSSFPTTSDPSIERDANRESISLAYNDTDPKPLLTDSNGRLIMDIVVE